MQNVDCYYCHSAQHTPYAEENGYTLVKCKTCGLLYVNPRPSLHDIEESHRQGVHRGQSLVYTTGKFEENKIPHYLSILSTLFPEHSAKNTTWLDIGCGHGEFLKALQLYFNGEIDAVGSEPNQQKQQSAQQRGLNVQYIDLENHTQQYDTVSLLNVYSHLPDPRYTLQQWSKLVKLGGTILIETGDTAHLSSKEHYRPFYLPDHLSFASEKIVVDILHDAGFSVSQVEKYHITKTDLKTIIREIVKGILPHKVSRLRYLAINRDRYVTDMYIKAIKTS